MTFFSDLFWFYGTHFIMQMMRMLSQIMVLERNLSNPVLTCQNHLIKFSDEIICFDYYCVSTVARCLFGITIRIFYIDRHENCRWTPATSFSSFHIHTHKWQFAMVTFVLVHLNKMKVISISKQRFCGLPFISSMSHYTFFFILFSSNIL